MKTQSISSHSLHVSDHYRPQHRDNLNLNLHYSKRTKQSIIARSSSAPNNNNSTEHRELRPSASSSPGTRSNKHLHACIPTNIPTKHQQYGQKREISAECNIKSNNNCNKIAAISTITKVTSDHSLCTTNNPANQ